MNLIWTWYFLLPCLPLSSNQSSWRLHVSILLVCFFYLDVSENSGYPPIIHLLIGFSIIFTIHFGVFSPCFWFNTPFFWSRFWLRYQWLLWLLRDRGRIASVTKDFRGRFLRRHGGCFFGPFRNGTHRCDMLGSHRQIWWIPKKIIIITINWQNRFGAAIFFRLLLSERCFLL